MSVRKIKGYRIIQEVGRGYKSTVYLAYDPNFEQLVSLKLINLEAFPTEVRDSLFDSFSRVAAAFHRVVHPHIVRMIDSGEFQGAPFIVFEAFRGISFTDIPKPIPIETAARFLRPVAEALDFLAYQDFNVPKLNLKHFALSSCEHVTLIDLPIEDWIFAADASFSAEKRPILRQLSGIFYELITGSPPLFRRRYLGADVEASERPAVGSALPESATIFFQRVFAQRSELSSGSGAEFVSMLDELVFSVRAEREKALARKLKPEPFEPAPTPVPDLALFDRQPITSEAETTNPILSFEYESVNAPVECEPMTPGSELINAANEVQPTTHDPESTTSEPMPEPESSESQPVKREPEPAGSIPAPEFESEPPESQLSTHESETGETQSKKRARGIGAFCAALFSAVLGILLLIRFIFLRIPSAEESLPDRIRALPSMALGSICEGLIQDALVNATLDGVLNPDATEAMTADFLLTDVYPADAGSTPASTLTPSATLPPTQTYPPTSTPTPTIMSTVTPTVTPTATPNIPLANELILSVMTSSSKEDYAYVKGRIALVDANVRLVASDLEGELKHANNGYIEEFSTDEMQTLKNFILEVDFLNPYDASFHDFDFGIIFRDEGNKNNQYRISMDSDGVWAFQDNKNQTTGTLVDSGYLPTFNRLKDEVNSVLLIVQNERGLLYFNEAFVKELNLEEREIVGKVAVGTGFFSGDEVDGYATGYRNLSIRDLGELELQLFDPIPCDPWGEIEIIRAYGNPLTSVQKTNGIAELAITGGMIVIEPPLAAQAYDWEAVVEPDHFNKKPVRRECEWIGARVHCGPFRWTRPAGGTPYIFQIYRKDSKCLVSEVTMDNVYFNQVWNLLRN